MDEPTNHLDIHAVEWLEKYLAAFPGAVLAVSHDRYFIDNYATFVWEIEFGSLQTYRGKLQRIRQAARRRTRNPAS